MKILLIEDDPNKSRRISDALRSRDKESIVNERRSYQSGLAEALSSPAELMILDMTMPTYDVSSSEKGGRTKAYAGRDILRELQRKQVRTRVIVVTQFESFGEGDDAMTLAQLKSALARDFPDNYVTTIFYEASDSRWAHELVMAIDGIRSV